MELWTKHISSDERLGRIPSIALLSFKEEEEFFRSRNLPVGCYVVRPLDLFEIDTITHALKEFVESIPIVKDDQFS